MSKISVVIPVYNSEKYLRDCLESVKKQTFEDFEVLLINDGSTDSSGKICDDYAKKDSRIKVFHKKNEGVSIARNLGVENAKSEWICFVDSDDTILEDHLENFNLNADLNCDIVFQNFLVKNKNNNLENISSGNYTKESFLKSFKIYPLSPWSKLYKKFFILNHNVFFDPDFFYGEDSLFNIKYLCYVDQIKVISNETYIYRDTPSSLSKKKLGDYNKNLKFFIQLNGELTVLTNGNDIIRLNALLIPQEKLLKALFLDLTFSEKERFQKFNRLLKEYKKEFLYYFKHKGRKFKIFTILLENNQWLLLFKLYQFIWRLFRKKG